MLISNQVAIVTGANSGLGRAAAQMLLQAGARVAAIDLNMPTTTAQDPKRFLALSGDVAKATDMETAFVAIQARWAPARILVNCAGILGPARVFRIDKRTGLAEARPLEAFQRVIDVNLVGTFNTLRLFAHALSHTGPQGTDEERGVIVNTASIAAYEALSAQAAYGASKAGVESMTLPLARELAQYGIRVMTLAPGTFETGIYEIVPPHTRRTLIDDVPFPKRPGRPEEFAHMVRALIENPMMNGCTVRIDGAVRMREPTSSHQETAS
ncbi:MAG: SDR family NAD(P)-dependent oxidoreductase [Proteobacteria bacterium]|nr:SDR family NAD(P)-dependent oxidoreductase [Pseudomonadota bacterium]